MNIRLRITGHNIRVCVLAFCMAITAIPAYGESVKSPDLKSKQVDWRDGWLLGIGVIGGRPINNDCSDCYTSVAAGMGVQIGYMLNPRLALMLDTHGLAVGTSQIEGYGVSANVLVQGVAAVAVQYWPARRFWIKGGFGRGEVRGSATVVSPTGGSIDIIETEVGLGFLAGVGFELYQGQTMAVNLQTLYAAIQGNDLSRGSFIVGLGFAWYL